MKPIVLTAEQRREIERRRKKDLDRRVYQRLTAVLSIAEGKSRDEVAHTLGIGLCQLGEWLRLFRNQGIDVLCTLHYKGDPGNLTPHQVDRLRDEVGTGRFRNSNQIRHWILETFGVPYKSSGVKDLLRRIGVSYHKVTAFLWKADPEKQKEFVKKYRRQKAKAHRRGGGSHTAVFRGRLPPGLGAEPRLLLLVAGGAAVPGGHGRRTQTAEHPGGVLP